MGRLTSSDSSSKKRAKRMKVNLFIGHCLHHHRNSPIIVLCLSSFCGNLPRRLSDFLPFALTQFSNRPLFCCPFLTLIWMVVYSTRDYRQTVK